MVQFIVRVNGGLRKNSNELALDVSSCSTVKDVAKYACRKLGDNCDYRVARIYNRKGILLSDGDY